LRFYPQRVLLVPIVWPFETSRAVLEGQARRIVEAAAEEIRHARRVTCVGYTDSAGASGYNLGLGHQRGQAVCDALRALGVQASFKVESRGLYGPRATNNTATGRALNRRVELHVAY
jgi:outer membrane protein OmpA-like peptidoglycan-associated protein